MNAPATREMFADPVIFTPAEEDRLDLQTLVGKTVREILADHHGYTMRFTDGTLIHVNRNETFDCVGNFVREP